MNICSFHSRSNPARVALFISVFIIALIMGRAPVSTLLAGDLPEADATARPQMSTSGIMNALENAASDSPVLQFLGSLLTMFIILGILIDIRFLYRRISRSREAKQPPRDIPWRIADVAKAAGIVILFIMALRLAAPLFRLYGINTNGVPFIIGVQLGAEIAVLTFIFRLLPSPLLQGLKKLGIPARLPWRPVVTGIKAYIGFLPVLVLLTLLTELLGSLTGIPIEPQEQFSYFFENLSTPALLFLVLFVVILGPLFEEIFFRGFTYQAIRRRLGPWPGIIITAVLFSFLHASISVLLPIFGLGILLAWIFEQSGSLVPSITIHICQNGVAVIAALLLKTLS